MAIIRNQPPKKLVAVSETNIQNILWREWMDRFELMAPNLTFHYGEGDLMCLRESGYLEEYEIKISKSDFNADKKKAYKHMMYNPDSELTPAYAKRGRDTRIPNRFWYVCCFKGAKDLEVPPYAGLIIITPTGSIKQIKYAPLLHKGKNVEMWRKKMARSLMFRAMNPRGIEYV